MTQNQSAEMWAKAAKIACIERVANAADPNRAIAADKYLRILAEVAEAAGWDRGATMQGLAEFVGALCERANQDSAELTYWKRMCTIFGEVAGRNAEKARKRIAELERRDRELAALEAHGVDNWEGYGDAVNCGELGEGCDICV
ncbi:hypothetical protein [Saccharopolyspora hattusasensis]|uniref:hypothetical protein n=1 Tax=Saccharopolyspora hattusasensis TaxID=1128679 RepID=UPI003D95CF97